MRRYIDFVILLIPTPSSFLQQLPYYFVHFKNVFCSTLFCFCAIIIANIDI